MSGPCQVCGWPENDSICPACGARLEPTPTRRDFSHPALASPRPDDYPDLKAAFLAWTQGDWARMVGQCLVALEIERPNISRRPQGPGWTFVQDSAAIYVAIDSAARTIRIESPILQLPEKRRIPLMRLLLELNRGQVGLARFYLRREKIVLGYSDDLANVSPPKLVLAIRDVALRADDFDDALAIAFDAEMLGPKAQRQNLDWSLVADPIQLTLPQVEEDIPALPDDALGPAPVIDDLSDLDLDLDLPDSPRPSGPNPVDLLLLLLEQALRHLHVLPNPQTKAVTERAALFHAYDQYRESCPEAIHLLVARAQTLLAPGFGKQERGVASALGRLGGLATLGSPAPAPGSVRAYLEFVFKEIIEKRGEVGPQPPPNLQEIRVVAEAKEHLQRLLDWSEQLPDSPLLEHFVYSGLVLEILHRIHLNDKTRDRLRQSLTDLASPTPEAVLELRSMIRRLAQ